MTPFPDQGATEWRLRFVARSERSYTLEYTTDPVAGRWIALQDVAAATGDRPLEFYFEPDAIPAPCYFRLVTPGRN